MLLLIIAVGGVGFLLGLWLLRAHVIALVSCALVVGCVAISAHAQWGVWGSIGLTVALVSALQACYLADLLAAVAWMRAKAPQTNLRIELQRPMRLRRGARRVH
jgi:hypothetical protein